jgi:glycosyltransferase involved in cell wall biosynthesis
MTDKIAIIGPYPPPYGGISVHVKRILELIPPGFFRLYNYNPSKYPSARDFYGKKKYLVFFIFFFCRYRLIHCHSGDRLLRLQFSFLGFFNRNIYLHIHNERFIEELERKGPVAWLQRKWIRNVHIIAVSSSITRALMKYNPASIQQIEAFLPPVFNRGAIDEFMKKYENFFQGDRFVVSMTGWFDYYKGKDLYGFDMAAEMLKRFYDRNMPVSLVATINGIRERELYDAFTGYVEENGLRDYVLLLRDFPEGWLPLLASRVFIRTTNTDGDAVSIREALWVGTPVIASDCVNRPEGTILFRNRSLDDLFAKILEQYNLPRGDIGSKIEAFGTRSYSSKLLSDVYKL